MGEMMTSPCADCHDPLVVFLVSSGSRGDRLLFRYPYETDQDHETTLMATPAKSPYAVRIAEDYQTVTPENKSSISSTSLVGYSDKVLRHLLAIKTELCGRRFAVKVNDVLFVGYPMLVQNREAATTSFNVVFALRASSEDSLVAAYQDLSKQIAITLSPSVSLFSPQASSEDSLVAAYQDLSKQIAITLRHEEKRCDYVSQQKAAMLTIQDEAAAMTEDSIESPFRTILQRCSLAEQLKAVYDDLCQCGLVNVYINHWLRVNFCLPHKLHSLHLPQTMHGAIKPEATEKCVAALRPYHALLLLLDQLLLTLPPDSSPALSRLVQVASPLKSLQSLASDADLSLGQTFQLVTHLVYWGKALIVYPLCESNVYTVAPATNTHINSWLVEKFAKAFHGMSLPAVLAEFSLPTPLGEHRDVLGLQQQQAQQVQMVVWMLQHKLLIQLHIYVFLAPAPARPARSSETRADAVFSTSLEDAPDLTKFPSFSDLHSALSEGSPEQSTFSTFSTKSASVDVASGGAVVTEEARKQWLVQDTLLAALTPGQRRLVLNCPAASTQDDLKLFARLCPYFNGKHHLEEIMYYENVRRSQLLTLLDKFRDVLITCQHEDPALAGIAS